MARPRKYDHDEVVEKMTLAFWERGYNGISMDDIGRITQLNRGSIYNAFGDKRALYLLALETYAQQSYGGAAQLVQDAPSTEMAVRSLYQAAFKGLSGEQTRWGCLLCNAAVEVAPVDQEVSDTVKKYLGLLSRAFVTSLKVSSPEASDASRVKNVAEQLTASYVGFNIMARAGVSTACLQRVSESAIDMTLVKQ